MTNDKAELDHRLSAIHEASAAVSRLADLFVQTANNTREAGYREECIAFLDRLHYMEVYDVLPVDER